MHTVEGDVHTFKSPDSLATISMDSGTVGRWGPIDEADLRRALEASGVPGSPVNARLGDLRGYQVGHVNGQGRLTHIWAVRSGRFALVIELRSDSKRHDLEAIASILSEVVIDQSALDAIPVERDIYGFAGRIFGGAYSFVAAHLWAVVLLLLAALLVVANR